MINIAKFKNYKNKIDKKNRHNNMVEVEINGTSHIVKYHQNAETLISKIVKKKIEIIKDKCHGSVLAGTAHIEFRQLK